MVGMDLHNLLLQLSTEPLGPPLQVQYSIAYTADYTSSLDPIDLTHDEDEALQRALALSMQDVHHQGSHVSQEDRDLSR